jgi:hypothetical protein
MKRLERFGKGIFYLLTQKRDNENGITSRIYKIENESLKRRMMKYQS